MKTQQWEMIETYIRKHLAKGISRDKIKQALIKAKWDEHEIEEAFKAVSQDKQFAKNMQPRKEATKASGEKKKPALDDIIGKSKKG